MLKRKIMLMRLLLMKNGYKRAEYLKKKKLFYKQGEHCFFVPYNYGTEPYLLSFGDNVHVATGVRFITHDITAKMFQYMNCDAKYTSRIGKIEVGDNVFIGADAVILYDIKIGNNVIIAAGALVNQDIPDGGIYGGIPARKIGEFSVYMDKIKNYSDLVSWTDDDCYKIRRDRQIEWLFGDSEK